MIDNNKTITAEGLETGTDTVHSRPSDCYTSGVLDLHLQDCMEGMRAYPDKHFDLAIVDKII